MNQESVTLAKTPIRAAAEMRGYTDPEGALKWAQSLSSPELQNTAMESVFNAVVRQQEGLKALELWGNQENADRESLSFAVAAYMPTKESKAISYDDLKNLKHLDSELLEAIQDEFENQEATFMPQ